MITDSCSRMRTQESMITEDPRRQGRGQSP